MNGYRYFFKNIGLLTLSSFATRLLSFLLVPLYTNVLTTTEYGTYDLIISTIGVLIPVLTLNIQDAVLRFLLDKKTNEKHIVSIATKYFFISNIIVICFLIVNHFLTLITILDEYAILFFGVYFVQALSGLMSAYIRGIDRVADLSLSSIIASAITIGLNILLLVVLKWGLVGYFVANIIGPLGQSLFLIFKSKLWEKITFDKCEDEAKQMRQFSCPLIANNIAWWVNNVSDRYVVTFFCGLAENGVYSVAGKIPQILNIVQTIVNQAWTLSAIKDYDPEDRNGFFSNTYRAYNCLMVLLCSAVILFNKVLAKMLYAKDFYVAWEYVPWLTIAIVFGALSGYIGALFSAVKDSKIFATSTIYGAVINVALNFIFTPTLGAQGAAIATAVSFAVVWAFRLYQSKKYIKLKLNMFRDIVSYGMLVTQAVIMKFCLNKLLYILETSIFIIIVCLYIEDTNRILGKILKKLR